MPLFSGAMVVALFVSCLALARGDGQESELLESSIISRQETCADSTKLLPFLTKQIKHGSSLVVFEATSIVKVTWFVVGGWGLQV